MPTLRQQGPDGEAGERRNGNGEIRETRSKTTVEKHAKGRDLCSVPCVWSRSVQDVFGGNARQPGRLPGKPCSQMTEIQVLQRDARGLSQTAYEEPGCGRWNVPRATGYGLRNVPRAAGYGRRNVLCRGMDSGMEGM